MGVQVQGLCAVCSRPGVLQTCTVCGATVCERHIHPDRQVCANCRGGSSSL